MGSGVLAGILKYRLEGTLASVFFHIDSLCIYTLTLIPSDSDLQDVNQLIC